MLNRLSSQNVPKEIQNKLDWFFGDLKEIGVAYIGHGVVNDQGNHTGYFSNREWGELYIQNQYFFFEPIIQNYTKKDMSLIPWGTLEDNHSIARIRSEYTKISSGVTLCKKDNEFNTFFNIGFSQDIDLIDFLFFKRDVLLSYFQIFNNYHLFWRKSKSC